MQLDQRQRLQYAVVQVGGHVGALLLALLQRALRAQIPDHRHDPWHDRQQHADKHRQAGDQHGERGMPCGRHRADMRGDVQRICGENDRNAGEHRPQLAFLRVETKPGHADADHAEQYRQNQRAFETGRRHHRAQTQRGESRHGQQCGFRRLSEHLFQAFGRLPSVFRWRFVCHRAGFCRLRADVLRACPIAHEAVCDGFAIRRIAA